MEAVIQFLSALEYNDWLVVGFALLAFALIDATGVALWLGISAIVTALAVYLFPIRWEIQLVLFGTQAIVAVCLTVYRMKVRKANAPEPTLNNIHSQLVGHEFVNSEDWPAGTTGRVNIGDSSWLAKSDSDIKAGEKVIVRNISGVTLIINKTK